MIGKATNVDRVYYWENKHVIAENQWYSSQIFEWCKDGTIAQIDNPELQDIPFSFMDGFIEPMVRGELFTSLVKEMEDGNAKEILASQDIISILVLPVYVKGFFHGFVGFDDCTTEKVWEANEISLLKSFALSLSKLIERNIMEKEINQARNNFFNFFNTISDMLFVLDATGNIILINDTTSKRLGYSEQELAGKSVLLVHPEGRRDEANRIVGEMLGGTADFCPVPLITRQGIEIPVETRIVMGEWDGKPALFGVTKDISELKKSEEKFSKAFHAGGTVMAILTIDKGIYIDVNQPFLETLGYSREEIIGKSSTSLNIFANLNDRITSKNQFLSDGKVSNLEMTVRSKDGSLLTGIFNIVPLNFGDEPCWLTTMTDITLRKVIEDELIKSKESAIIANLAKSQFLSNMSHEIRTPMNAVIAYTELLNGTELSPTQDKYLSRIKISAQVLLEIITDILDLSKLEAGKIQMESVPLHLDLVIGNAISQVRIKAEKKGLKLKLYISDGVPLELKGDPLRLQQILTNLLDNSVKFTDKGDVSIHVTAQSSSENKILLNFEVSDTGIGMSEDQLEKIFEPFYQTGNDSSRMKLGTGLGLSICKHFVTLFGGEIWVESHIGHGTTFHFSVLLFNPDNPPNARMENEQPMFKKPDFTVTDSLKDLRALVVEDNEINQDVLQEILTSANMEVVIVSNGFDAITKVKQQDFDVVLMDVRMPGMDGFETTTQIRKSKNMATLPIIAVSASVMSEDITKAKEAGFNDYLSKPIAMEQLFKKIAFWCTENSQEYANAMKTAVDHPLAGEIPCDIGKLLELSPSICGIDAEAALHRLGGNYKLFCKLLKKFSNSHSKTVETIRIELVKNEFKTAERLAHTLIGSSGDIGARDVYSAAVAMESEIHSGISDNAEAILGKLDEAMKKVLYFIPLSDDKLSKEANQPQRVLDVPQVKNLLENLTSLLLDNDLDAVETLDEVDRIAERTVIDGKIKEMKRLGEQYKYAEALIVLNEINKMLEEEETHGNR